MYKYKLIIFFFCYFFFIVNKIYSQVIITNKDSLIINSVIIESKYKNQQENIKNISNYFINTPYGYGILDSTEQEKHVVCLTKFDCVTFVETVLALNSTIISENPSLDKFISELERIRYKNGNRCKIMSRLHYFEDWILDNTKKHYLVDLTKEIGGVSYNKRISFMSENSDKYFFLRSFKENLDSIKEIEKYLSKQNFFYIPKDKIKKIQNKILSGDVIAITTVIDNLDIVHTGFAYWKDGELFLIHASSKNGKVLMSTDPLSEYLLNNSKQSGIMVLRHKCN